MKDKQPVELTVEITNSDEIEKMVSLDIVLPKSVGLDKSCINKAFTKRYNKVTAGQKIIEKQLLYLSPHAEIGETTGQIKVAEHYQEFGNVTNSYSKTLALRIVA
jgi:hypothetical protein